MIRVVQYVDAQGRSPYAAWFEALNAVAAAKVSRAVYRLAGGNFSNVKGVGAGVFERTIDFGPGYRVYFGKQGEQIVILLGGSTKARQKEAISIAKGRWWEYTSRRTT
jgi:putative addiction module killer protein